MKTRFVLASLMLFASAPIAFAETQTDSHSSNATAKADEEIIVIADWWEKAPGLLEPDRIRSAVIANQPTPDLASLLAGRPGLTLAPSGGLGSQTSLFIRGAESNHVVALFDGIRLNDAASPSGAFDFGSTLTDGLERIEITRGAGSALYGPDAIGGAINLIPQRDTYATPGSTRMSIGLGTLGLRQISASTFGTIGDLSYGFSAANITTDGFNVTPKRFDEAGFERDGADLTSGHVLAAYEVSPSLTVDVLARRATGSSAYDTFSGGMTGFQRADATGLVSKSRSDLGRIRATATPTSGLTISLALGGQDNHRFDLDRGIRLNDFVAHNSFAELRARYRFSSATLILGADSVRDSVDIKDGFSDPLTREEHRTAVLANLVGTLPFDLDYSLTLRRDAPQGYDPQTTWRLGLTGLVMRSFDVYLTAGTAFKAPSLYERFASSAFTSPNPDLEPETARTLEIGVSFQSLDVPIGKANAEFAVFDTRTKNLITGVYDPTSFTFSNINLDRARSAGAEGRVEWQVGMVTLAVSAAYIDAKDQATKAPLLRRPRQSYAAELRLEPDSGYWGAQLNWSKDGRRTDVVYDNDGFYAASGVLVPGVETVNVSGFWAVNDHLTLQLAVCNLLDSQAEAPNGFARPPRTALLQVKTAF